MNSIRILIVDDQMIVRAGVRQLLNQISGVEIVGEATDGLQALELTATRQPEVLLLDLEMPGLNGWDTIVRLRAKFPEVKVIVLSAHATEPHMLRAIRAGANGYILKSSGPMEMDRAIQSVIQGQTYLSPEVYKEFRTSVRSAGTGESAPDPLTVCAA